MLYYTLHSSSRGKRLYFRPAKISTGMYATLDIAAWYLVELTETFIDNINFFLVALDTIICRGAKHRGSAEAKYLTVGAAGWSSLVPVGATLCGRPY